MAPGKSMFQVCTLKRLDDVYVSVQAGWGVVGIKSKGLVEG